MTITDLRHPFSAFKMRLSGSPRPIRLAVWIDMQNDFRDFLPICANAVGVEKAKVIMCCSS
jgi:hypothetical protein